TSLVTLVEGRADDCDVAYASARTTMVRPRALVTVIAGTPVRFDGVRAKTRLRIAQAWQVAVVQRFADNSCALVDQVYLVDGRRTAASAEDRKKHHGTGRDRLARRHSHLVGDRWPLPRSSYTR